jgi:hypothetical protein
MTHYSSRLLGVALCGFASMTVARANCLAPATFGQSGLTQYHYVVFPPGTPATSQSIVGRFWQPGAYQTTNQGACDESRWLFPCNGDCPSVTTNPAFWIYGEIGSSQCQPAGCIADEMILLLEERGSGGLFAIARVDDSAGSFLYDFSRLGRDIGLTSIPKPIVTSSQYIGSIHRVGFRFDDPAPGFYGLPGVPATGTITAIKLYSRAAATPDPLERSAWTLRARFPYVGGATTGTADLGDFCPGGGYHFAMAAALEFDGGQSETDYVSVPLSFHCTEQTTGASRVPEAGADALQISRDASGALALTWGAACFPRGANYNVYEGTIGDWTSHTPRICNAPGPTAVVTPAPESSYYLVVPFALNTGPPDVNFEGSYGLRSDGTERLPSTAACATQYVEECPGP